MTTADITLSERYALQHERKARIIAALVSVAITASIFFALWFFRILVPNPPFPRPDPLKEEEVVFDVSMTGGGFDIPGGGSSPSMGPGMSGAAMENPSASTQGQDADVTSPDGVNVGAQGSPTGTSTTGQAVPPPSDALQDLLNASHGDNSSSTIDPFGGGSNDPYGTNGHGPKGGPVGGPKGTGLPGLGGRGVLSRPTLSNPTQDEGLVVVEVIVDKNGKVKKADIIPSECTTQNTDLWRAARQDAFRYKFEPNKDSDSDAIARIKFDYKIR